MPTWFAFAGQLLLALGAFAIAPTLARQRRAIWVAVCIGSLLALLLWPLMRVFPTAPIDALGAPVVAMIELTGLFIPATLLLGIASRHVPKPSDRRAILVLVAIASLYFIRSGWWMIDARLPDLGPTRMQAGVCRQSTDYTCVAASMVTMLNAHGISAEESEMARLARIQVNGGATDSRALWALEQKLAATNLRPIYKALDVAALSRAPKPALVQLDWGFFISHMVPVMAMNSERVTVGDPLTGMRDMPMQEFARKWKGNAITLVPRTLPTR